MLTWIAEANVCFLNAVIVSRVTSIREENLFHNFPVLLKLKNKTKQNHKKQTNQKNPEENKPTTKL